MTTPTWPTCWRRLLEALGHSVRHAAKARLRWRCCPTVWRPEAVITDLMMPGGVSGFGLVNELRTRLPGLPVVLATGHGEHAAEFRSSGLPVLSKPFRAAELERCCVPPWPRRSP